MYEVPPFGQLIYWVSVFFLTLLVVYLTLFLEPPYYLLLVLLLIPVALALFGAWAVRPLGCAVGVLLVVFATFLLKTLTDL